MELHLIIVTLVVVYANLPFSRGLERMEVLPSTLSGLFLASQTFLEVKLFDLVGRFLFEKARLSKAVLFGARKSLLREISACSAIGICSLTPKSDVAGLKGAIRVLSLPEGCEVPFSYLTLLRLVLILSVRR